MANRKLGIHIASGALKLVELEQQGKSFLLTNFSVDYFSPEAGYGPHTKALAAALKKNHIHTKQADVVASSDDIVYKIIDLPPLSEGEAAASLGYKLKALLPAAFKEAVFAYYKLDKVSVPGKQLFFVAAAPKDKVLEIIKFAKECGILTKGVIAPSCALNCSPAIASRLSAAVIYLGKYSSVIALVKEGQVVFAREVRIGGEDIAQSMVGAVVTEQGKLEIDYNRAEEIRNKFGVPINLEKYTVEAGVPAAEILAMMRPALEKMAAEIGNTIEYYQKEIGDAAEFKKVYFTGGAAATRNLVEYFKLQLNIEAEILPIDITTAKEEIKSYLPVLSMAIGSVIGGKDRLLLAPKIEGRFSIDNLTALLVPILNNLKGYIYSTCLFLVVMVVLFYFASGQRNKLIIRQGELQSQYLNAVAEMTKKVETGKGMIDLSKFKDKDRFTLLMNSLVKIAPSEVSLLSANYENNTNQLIIRGVIPRKQQKIVLTTFMKNLLATGYLSTIDLVSLKESETYQEPTYYFELTCLLKSEVKK
ncbi:MAG: pilus assembly protein PilM [Candidatus Margulisbacteria bacterium]|nr:pilus assembly protein PilM [Candidatus Margulisiibacteriota bacterium]